MFANSYFHRGNVYFKRDIDGDYKKAIDDYTKAIEMPLPHSLKTADLKTALLNRAQVYRAIGETEKAEADEARAAAL